MEFTKLVEERRSIRAFKAGMEVKKSDLEEMIKCAIEAPTWKNSQTGRYYVVSSSDMMDKIRSEALPEFNQNSSANAGALIITAFEKTRSGFELPLLAVQASAQSVTDSLPTSLVTSGVHMIWGLQMSFLF